MASGPAFGAYHQHAERYKAILARDGVTVDERMTDGAQENLRLLLDPKSGVDVAFMQGGVATAPATDGLVMLASLYYEPVWVFYRGAETLTVIKQLQGRRIAIGVPGSGTYALASRILDANGMTLSAGVGRGNTDIVAIGGTDALAGLKSGEIDAAMFVGGAQTGTIQEAMREPAVKLMSVERAEAYPRRYRYLTTLRLPPGTIDLALNIPDREVVLVGTRAMLAAREDFHPALVNLLIEAAREIHGEQGYFEAAGEFPGITPVDLRVSPHADQHKRFGPSFLHRYLPFWVATVLERTIVLIVPLLVVLIPLFNHLPQLLRWRVRKRIFRWYGELVLLERDIGTREGPRQFAQWQQDLDRIERAVGNIRTPASYASEAYTLREHVALVRRTLAARMEGSAAPTA